MLGLWKTLIEAVEAPILIITINKLSGPNSDGLVVVSLTKIGKTTSANAYFKRSVGVLFRLKNI